MLSFSFSLTLKKATFKLLFLAQKLGVEALIQKNKNYAVETVLLSLKITKEKPAFPLNIV